MADASLVFEGIIELMRIKSILQILTFVVFSTPTTISYDIRYENLNFYNFSGQLILSLLCVKSKIPRNQVELSEKNVISLRTVS